MMQLLPPAAAATGLLLILLCSCSVFPGTDSAAKSRPTISTPLRFSPSFGQNFSIACHGHSTYPRSSLIYWLANGTFVDDVYPEGAVSQKDPREKPKGSGLSLERKLIFRAFAVKDLHTRFECTILDPSGAVRRALSWEMQESQENSSGAP